MPAATTQVTLAWTASAGTTVRNGGVADTFPVITSDETFDLATTGSTAITLGITGAGGAHTLTLTIIKAAAPTPDTDATFDFLEFYPTDATNAELALTPQYDAASGVTDYRMSVIRGITQVHFEFDTTHANAVVTDADGTVLTDSGTITLTDETTTYTLTVTPPTASAAVTYTFTITGGPAAPVPVLTIAADGATLHRRHGRRDFVHRQQRY